LGAPTMKRFGTAVLIGRPALSRNPLAAVDRSYPKG
jgi:hypothetical protein